MRAFRRLQSLLRTAAYERAWRSVERAIARRRLQRRVEIQRLEELRSRYFPDRSPIPSEAPWKYLEINRALDANLRRAQHLGLLRDCRPAGSRRVLDLGCGAGLFLFVCKTHGYECVGLDVGDVPLYDDFLEILGVERVDARLEAFGRLPRFERPFDYITAFGTVFNRYEAHRWWSEREWKHFLDDVGRHLAPGGRLFIEPNPMGGPADGERWMSRYTPDVFRGFMARGGIVDPHGVLFPSKAPEAFPASPGFRLPSFSGLASRVPWIMGRRALVGADRPRGSHRDRPNRHGARSRPTSRRSRILGRTALSLAGLLVGFSCAEVGLRSFNPQEIGLRWYSREGVMVFVPGFRGTYVRPGFSSRIETDSDGLRDREYPPEKSEGTFRILVLGDSLTAGLQVPVEETYPKRLESLLAASRPARRVEVVNAGIPGYGTADELRYLEAFGARWKPDLVLVAFFGGNDVENNLSEGGVYYNGEKIQVRRRPLTEWQYRIKGLRSWIASHSHLYQFLRDRLRFDTGGATSSPSPPPSGPGLGDRARGGESRVEAARPRPSPRSAGVDGARGRAQQSRETRAEPEPPCSTPGSDCAKGWQLTIDLLGRIEEVSRGVGARFALMTIPGPWQNDRSSLEQGPDPEDLASASHDPLQPGRTICEFASSLGTSCIDLLPGFQALGPERSRYWKSDRHFTSMGHETTARLLATFLVSRKLIPESPPAGRRAS